MRELWDTVVRPAMEILAPRHVVVLGPADDPLLAHVRASGVEVLEVTAGNGVPADAEVIIAAAAAVPLAAGRETTGTRILHGAGSADWVPSERDDAVLHLPAFGGVTVVVSPDLDPARAGALRDAMHTGTMAGDVMRALERERIAVAPALAAQREHGEALHALRRRVQLLSAEVVRLGGRVTPVAEPPTVRMPAEGDVETLAASWFASRYDSAALLAALGRTSADDLSDALERGPVPHGTPRPAAVAFVLSGLANGGSGGTHSIVQEALGLAALGIVAQVLVPRDDLGTAAVTYPEAGDVLRPYDVDRLADALVGLEVVIATEYSTVAPVVRAASRAGVRTAYYVQDYEPFFNAPGSARADAAAVSYGLDPTMRLFAKTDWLVNVVRGGHRVDVRKVRPSLDGATFRPSDRPRDAGGPVRVTAMLRPRTPRRRPAATVRVLQALADELGRDVEVVTFGCDARELHGMAAHTHHLDHRGILPRAEVAALLRTCDVFVDLSLYQAFGRTGLEAMACGAVPVLPRVGGVREYARDGVDAVLVDTADERAVTATLVELCRDPERLARLRAGGRGAARRFTVQEAAASIADALRP